MDKNAISEYKETKGLMVHGFNKVFTVLPWPCLKVEAWKQPDFMKIADKNNHELVGFFSSYQGQSLGGA